jgi:Dihydrofolate reductase
MQNVIYAMSVSLVGFIEATNGDISWSDPDEELHKHFNELESAIDIHLYGRWLCENMVANRPTADENPLAPEYEKEYARLWKTMPKIVFSRTLDRAGWNARLVSGNIAEEVNRMKRQLGKYMSVSGAGIASSFMQLGLIDEYWMFLHPIILGGGKSMFRHLRDKINLQLVETRKFGRGVVLLRTCSRPSDNDRQAAQQASQSLT